MLFYILCALFLVNVLFANTTALNNTATPAPCKDNERMTEICETAGWTVYELKGRTCYIPPTVIWTRAEIFGRQA
ncbi:hypothetical protein GCK32_001034 [Trichostrongylus colubriformis]|uniref:Uncharacterized protein n=1 Tax=Trichostrongylus colubriformis TaxID=6319 RepID=A0AAN8FZX2_TRICO